MIDIERPFSPRTLAERWDCSAEKIRQMCRRGELGWFPVGKEKRIPAREVERIECLKSDHAGDSSSIADSGASLTGVPAGGFRLERMTAPGPRLSLVRSGGD